MAASERSLPTLAILAYALFALLAGHLLLREYMPNPAVGLAGFLLVGLILSLVLFVQNDKFGFVLVIYICSHFGFADNQGGLWNLMAFGLISAYWLMGNTLELKRQPDTAVNVFLGVLLLWNILGWLLQNPMPIVDIGLGAAAFVGFLLVFNFVSNMEITTARVRRFLAVTFVMLVYQAVVALNQRYAWVNWNTPLIGAYGELRGIITYKTTNAMGTLRHSELFGEYGVLMLALTMALLASTAAHRQIKFWNGQLMLMVCFSLLAIFLTSTRSAAVLAIPVIGVYSLIVLFGLSASIDRLGRLIVLGLFAAVTLPLVAAYTGFFSLEKDFSQLSNVQFSLQNVISGEALNRGNMFEVALMRLEAGSWMLGNGFGSPASNMWAWFGMAPGRDDMPGDYHNLYLSLPMLYGWIGTVAFLLVVLLVAYRAFSIAIRFRKQQSYLFALAGGFAVLWCVFLIDQYKISILRNPNYHMMFWIWLGLTNAVVRTVHAHRRGRRGAPVPEPEAEPEVEPEPEAEDAPDTVGDFDSATEPR